MTDSSSNDYLAVPRSGKGPGVLVLHAWWGLNDIFRGFADRLAEAGFVALAPDLFGGKIARTVAEAEALREQANEAEDTPPIVLAALEKLRRHPAVSGSGLGTIGFSLGGYWAVWLATYKPELIRAVTVFYATGEGDFRQSQAAFQGHFAEQDPYEPVEGVKAFEQSLVEAGRPATFYTYPGTGHWFFERDRPDAYDPQAAELAFDRTVAFLRAQLADTPGR